MLKWIKKIWKWLRPGDVLYPPIKPCVGPTNAEVNDIIMECLPPLPLDPWFGVDEGLPRVCPNCDSNTVPSKIDDRVAACLNCKMMFLTEGAYLDPNIQRDIVHTKVGFRAGPKA